MYFLYSWGSPFQEKGLYSFDPACASVQAYLQLCKAEWKLCPVSSAGISPNNCLPAITYKNTHIESGVWSIVQFLKKEGHDLDAGLDEEQLSQSTAYISLVQDSLVDSLLFSWYLVSENFADAIRPRLAKMFKFPLGLFIPTQLKDHAEERLRFRGITSEIESSDDKQEAQEGGNLQALKNKIPRIYLLAKEGFRRHADKSSHPVYKHAAKCLDLLSTKLGSKQYFFGDAPAMLDAVVYGYLSLVIYPDLPQSTLKEMVTKSYPNLVALCDRIRERIEEPTVAVEQSWPSSVYSMAKQCVASYMPQPKTKQGDDESNGSRLSENTRSIACALFVFVGYIVYNDVFSHPAST
ncbi:hypothetical protein LPJ56_001235 [Coemansia sp. RSA 2599]|nr:hypothetical protein LPJ75_000816 [Coemansia sp. RSA 2598]KAJ1828225.1 hypothetical protein LPJ56_001235 [Coemansia sp. RSA 2599]